MNTFPKWFHSAFSFYLLFLYSFVNDSLCSASSLWFAYKDTYNYSGLSRYSLSPEEPAVLHNGYGYMVPCQRAWGHCAGCLTLRLHSEGIHECSSVLLRGYFISYMFIKWESGHFKQWWYCCLAWVFEWIGLSPCSQGWHTFLQGEVKF